jgi:hypothetical protein
MYQKEEDIVSVLARLKEARLTYKKPTPTRNNSLRLRTDEIYCLWLVPQ